MAVDAAGRVWAGTETAGISVFEPERSLWTPFTSLLQPIPGDGSSACVSPAPPRRRPSWSGRSRATPCWSTVSCARPAWRGSTSAAFRATRSATSLAVGGRALARHGRAAWWCSTPTARWSPRGERPRDGASAAPRPGRQPLPGHRSGAAAATLWVWRNGRWGAAGDAVASVLVRSVGPAGRGRHALRRRDRRRLPAGRRRLVAGRRHLHRGRRPGTTPSPSPAWLAPPRAASTPAPRTRWNGATGSGNGGAARWVQHRLDGPSLLASYKSIAFDADGTLWISSAKPPRLAADHPLPGRAVDLLPRKRGRAVATPGRSGCSQTGWRRLAGPLLRRPRAGGLLPHGAHRRAGERFQTWPIVNAFDLAPDGQGRLWIATSGLEDDRCLRPLSRRSAPPDSTAGSRSRSSTPGAALKSDLLNAVAVDGNQVWIGYPDDGVSRWDLGADRQPLTSDDRWVAVHRDAGGKPAHREQGEAHRARSRRTHLDRHHGRALHLRGPEVRQRRRRVREAARGRR